MNAPPHDVPPLHSVKIESHAAGTREVVDLIGSGGSATRVPGINASGVPDLAEGYLRSMLASGKPQLLVSVAQGLLQLAGGDDAMRLHAGAAGVAASWRLCNWPCVRSFLQVRALSPALSFFFCFLFFLACFAVLQGLS